MRISQLIKNPRVKKIKKTKAGLLNKSPFKKGVVLSVVNKTPKKPNSGLRKTAKIRILQTKKETNVYIPGIKHNIREHSNVLIKKGGARDLPGVDYTIVRGVYDAGGVQNRKNGRSKYGTKK